MALLGALWALWHFQAHFGAVWDSLAPLDALSTSWHFLALLTLLECPLTLFGSTIGSQLSILTAGDPLGRWLEPQKRRLEPWKLTCQNTYLRKLQAQDYFSLLCCYRFIAAAFLLSKTNANVTLLRIGQSFNKRTHSVAFFLRVPWEHISALNLIFHCVCLLSRRGRDEKKPGGGGEHNAKIAYMANKSP